MFNFLQLNIDDTKSEKIMKKISLSFMLILFIVSKYSFALDITRDEIYKACLVVETKNAASDGQSKPKLAAHYMNSGENNKCGMIQKY